MNIYISRNKQKFGPYTFEDVQALIDQNIVAEMDYAWTDGGTEWVPLSSVEGLDFSREKKRVNLDEALKQARQRQTGSSSGIQPMANVGHDFRKLRNNVSATAEELRGFLGQMKGKSPKEMLGMVAQSTLFKGLQQSVIIFAGILIVFTVIPFTIGLFQPKEQKKAQTEKVQPADEDSEENGQENQPFGQEEETATTATDANGNPIPGGSTGTEFTEALGIGEAKEAPTKENPLDNSNNDILEDLK